MQSSFANRPAAAALVAFIAATAFTVFGLFLIGAPTHVPPVDQINGIRVVDLAPVQAVVDTGDANATATGHAGRVALLDADMVMPYYSFAAKPGTANKG